MKKHFFWGWLLLISPFLLAQKHDNTWVFGISNNINTNPGGVVMKFDQGYPTFSLENIGQYYSIYCAACSDSSGNLLFHTNGRKIMNRLHQVMENGSPINPGALWHDYPYGYISSTDAFPLPAPDSPNHYYLIHTSANNDYSSLVFFPILYSSLIDMNANDGLGSVVYKNDTMATGNITDPVAIKHGNGRDWWIIVADFLDMKYETYLLDPDGIHFIFDQLITPDAFAGGGNYLIASPDGRFLINNDDVSGLWIYDFDRCTGLLSHPRVLPYDPPVFYTAVNAFSKDGRFLITSTHLVAYQLDMQTIDDPVIAFDTIGRYEYGASPAPPSYTHFYFPQLAPDNKIYFQTFSNTNAYHVFNRPELPLLAADFSQRGLITPKRKYMTRCDFPAYDLGRLSGSPCDSLPFAGATEERFRHTQWQPADDAARGANQEVHIRVVAT
jgi:hypothetical protein